MRVRSHLARTQASLAGTRARAEAQREGFASRLDFGQKLHNLYSLMSVSGDEAVKEHPLLARLEAVAKSRNERADELSDLREKVGATFVDEARYLQFERRLSHLSEGFARAAKVCCHAPIRRQQRRAPPPHPASWGPSGAW